MPKEKLMVSGIHPPWVHKTHLKWDHADYKDGVVTGYIRCGKGFRRYEWEV